MQGGQKRISAGSISKALPAISQYPKHLSSCFYSMMLCLFIFGVIWRALSYLPFPGLTSDACKGHHDSKGVTEE